MPAGLAGPAAPPYRGGADTVSEVGCDRWARRIGEFNRPYLVACSARSAALRSTFGGSGFERHSTGGVSLSNSS